MFLKSYGDDSSDSQGKEIVCAGTILGWPRDFYYTGLQWEERLKNAALEYFRASDCEMLYGQFDPVRLKKDLNGARAIALSVRHDLIEILNGPQTGLAAVCVGVVLKDFEEFTAESDRARQFLGTDSVRLAYKQVIQATIALLEQDWIDLPKSVKVAFTFDEHQNCREAEEEYDRLKEEDESCARRMLIAGHADDKELPGLQMADLMASESRHKVAQWLNGSTEERAQFKQMARNQNIYYIGGLNRHGMEYEVNRLEEQARENAKRVRER